MKNAVIITGPTTVGKTTIALEVAKRLSGEIINSDRLYVYSFLKIGSGLSDNLKDSEIPKHLYGICKPEEILEVPQYVNLVENLVPRILARNKLPIIESCSSTYNPALIECNHKPDRIFRYYPIGLKWPAGTNIEKKIEARLEKMFQEGLLEEAACIFKQGYKQTHPVQISVVYLPLMQYFDGLLTLEQARQEILRRWLAVYTMQLEKFLSIKEIKWIEIGDIEATISQCITILEIAGS